VGITGERLGGSSFPEKIPGAIRGTGDDDVEIRGFGVGGNAMTKFSAVRLRDAIEEDVPQVVRLWAT
jgi:hypothetical protein